MPSAKNGRRCRKVTHAQAASPQTIRFLADHEAQALFVAGRQAARRSTSRSTSSTTHSAGPSIDPHTRTGRADVRNYAWRDYGNRVGEWRLRDLSRRAQVACLDLTEFGGVLRISGHRRKDQTTGLTTCWLRPHQCRSAARDVGILTSAALFKNASTSSRNMYRCKADRLDGAGAAETSVTPDLLKECGFTHRPHLPVDDQPIWMRMPSPLLSVPYPMELDSDEPAGPARPHGRQFADIIVDQFEELPKRRKSNRSSFLCRCMASFSDSRSVCVRCVRRSSIASSTTTPTRSGLRGPARSNNCLQYGARARSPTLEGSP